MFSDGHQQSALMMLVVNSFITTSVGTFSKESSPGVDAAGLKCLSDSRYDQVVLCCTVLCCLVLC